jgi:arginyl-tRNA synthetase
MTDPVSGLRATVLGAAHSLLGEHTLSAVPVLERPKRSGQGDYATNAAMLMAPVLGESPRSIAERLGELVGTALGDALPGFEVAGPGFLNLSVSDDWLRDAVRYVLDRGSAFGGGGAPVSQRVLIEFVSANPTGALVVASGGRHGGYGDSLARILTHYGHTVTREYYFNDAGSQIQRLGESIRARARGEEVPEGGYQGDYVFELASSIPGAATDPVGEVAARAVAVLMTSIKASLARYGVVFDNYFNEGSLHEGSPSAVERALAVLEEQGQLYKADGAVWLRTTAFGDDKDRVVVRSNGLPTYLAADVAYLQNKRERGFDHQILPLGSDHGAYVGELKAVMAALGGDPESIEVPLIQFVHLVEGGEAVSMSKRRGDFVTLDDLLDEIGVDATRYFMLQRSHDRTLDIDIALARSRSNENPVYYIQYAHARISSMLAKLGSDRVAAAVLAGADWGGSEDVLHPSERELIEKLLALPEEITEAVEQLGPHRIAAYALELAQSFTAFYRDCRVVGATPEGVESFRIALCVASRSTIALVLGLLGVSAPDSM